MQQNVFYYLWEPQLIEWIQSWMGSIGKGIASALAWMGEETAMVLILGFIYWCYDKKMGKLLGTNIVVALVLNPMVKNIAFRTRPYFNHPNIKCLKPVNSAAGIYDITAQGYSFPSGHATNSAVVYGSIATYKKTRLLIIIGILIPLLVGVSRVMLGVHYPTDVLVGWAMGFGVAIILTWVQNKIKNENILHFILFLCAIPGCFYCKTTDYFTALGIMVGFFLAIPFEQKFVKFENTKNIPFSILRVLGGVAVYLILNTALKLPFPKTFLEEHTMEAFLIRTIRYTIVIFIMLAVYPICFKKNKEK